MGNPLALRSFPDQVNAHPPHTILAQARRLANGAAFVICLGGTSLAGPASLVAATEKQGNDIWHMGGLMIIRRFLIQVLIAVMAATSVGFVALIFAAAIGGTSLASAPEFNFGLVESVVCPRGASIEYNEGAPTTSYVQPGPADPFGHWGTETPFSVSCVSAGETLDDSLGLQVRALIAVFSIYFLACFVPLFIPLMVIRWILVHKLLDAAAKRKAKAATTFRSL
jgi:hypothetical protein